MAPLATRPTTSKCSDVKGRMITPRLLRIRFRQHVAQAIGDRLLQQHVAHTAIVSSRWRCRVGQRVDGRADVVVEPVRPVTIPARDQVDAPPQGSAPPNNAEARVADPASSSKTALNASWPGHACGAASSLRPAAVDCGARPRHTSRGRRTHARARHRRVSPIVDRRSEKPAATAATDHAAGTLARLTDRARAPAFLIALDGRATTPRRRRSLRSRTTCRHPPANTIAAAARPPPRPTHRGAVILDAPATRRPLPGLPVVSRSRRRPSRCCSRRGTPPCESGCPPPPPR